MTFGTGENGIYKHSPFIAVGFYYSISPLYSAEFLKQ